MTAFGIEPEAFQFVSQHLNNCSVTNSQNTTSLFWVKYSSNYFV